MKAATFGRRNEPLALHTSLHVGGPADFYTMSYYQARELNAFAHNVVEVLETITDTRPRFPHWKPLSEDRHRDLGRRSKRTCKGVLRQPCMSLQHGRGLRKISLRPYFCDAPIYMI